MLSVHQYALLDQMLPYNTSAIFCCFADKCHVMLKPSHALQEMPLNMLTPNLHCACCRLYAQEEQRGAVAKDLELFIERDVQRVKENLKYRISARPEALFVNDKLADEALAARKSRGIRQFDAICPEYRWAPGLHHVHLRVAEQKTVL